MCPWRPQGQVVVDIPLLYQNHPMTCRYSDDLLPIWAFKMVLYIITMPFGTTSWARSTRYEKLPPGQRDMGGRHTPPLPGTPP